MPLEHASPSFVPVLPHSTLDLVQPHTSGRQNTCSPPPRHPLVFPFPWAFKAGTTPPPAVCGLLGTAPHISREELCWHAQGGVRRETALLKLPVSRGEAWRRVGGRRWVGEVLELPESQGRFWRGNNTSASSERACGTEGRWCCAERGSGQLWLSFAGTRTCSWAVARGKVRFAAEFPLARETAPNARFPWRCRPLSQASLRHDTDDVHGTPAPACHVRDDVGVKRVWKSLRFLLLVGFIVHPEVSPSLTYSWGVLRLWRVCRLAVPCHPQVPSFFTSLSLERRTVSVEMWRGNSPHSQACPRVPNCPSRRGGLCPSLSLAEPQCSPEITRFLAPLLCVASRSPCPAVQPLCGSGCLLSHAGQSTQAPTQAAFAKAASSFRSLCISETTVRFYSTATVITKRRRHYFLGDVARDRFLVTMSFSVKSLSSLLISKTSLPVLVCLPSPVFLSSEMLCPADSSGSHACWPPGESTVFGTRHGHPSGSRPSPSASTDACWLACMNNALTRHKLNPNLTCLQIRSNTVDRNKKEDHLGTKLTKRDVYWCWTCI